VDGGWLGNNHDDYFWIDALKSSFRRSSFKVEKISDDFTRLLHGYPWVPPEEGGPAPWAG